MRSPLLVATALASICTGCRSHEDLIATYVLSIDAAEIAAAAPDGQAWCATGSFSTEVKAVLAGQSIQTGFVAGLAPEWRRQVFEATAGEYARGVDLEVVGLCGESSVSLGTLTIRPRASRIHDGSVVVAAFGSSARLRMHFRLGTSSSYGDGSWIDDGGWPDCVDDDCGAVDDGSWIDDGSDPGSGDDGGWTDDSGWTDDGGWHPDDGGGGSTDDGGGSTDDGGGSGDGSGGYDDGGGSDDGSGGYDDGGGSDDDGGGSDDGGGGSDDGGGGPDDGGGSDDSAGVREGQLFAK